MVKASGEVPTMEERDGLICGYLLNGQGGGREVSWPEIRSWRKDGGVLWIHLDRTHAEAQTWLSGEASLDPVMAEALLAEETRPRTVPFNDGLLVILRGVNLNPGADPEDMVSIRIWLEPGRIVSLRSRPLMAIRDMIASLAAGAGPRDPGDFLVTITDKMVDRMGPVSTGLEDEADELEDQIVTAPSRELRVKLGALRRQAISLRRYLAPQRDVMTRLQVENVPWLQQPHKIRLREVGDQITRYVEDLDSARERIAAMQEELAARLAEQLNKNMYVLAIVAAVFLPLGLLTGLLGINVAGIPGSQNPWAFAIVSASLLGLAVILVAVFRRLKWL